jgi:hypothetical protein
MWQAQLVASETDIDELILCLELCHHRLPSGQRKRSRFCSVLRRVLCVRVLVSFIHRPTQQLMAESLSHGEKRVTKSKAVTESRESSIAGTLGQRAILAIACPLRLSKLRREHQERAGPQPFLFGIAVDPL